MRQIARALRVFAYPENLPIMVHCIHGEIRGCTLRVESRLCLMALDSSSWLTHAPLLHLVGCLASTVCLFAPAGKDRTGLIIALLLLTLGVPEEVVVLDYAKSEVELKVCWLVGWLASLLSTLALIF